MNFKEARFQNCFEGMGSGKHDPIAGTPYDKSVAVRLALVSAQEAAVYQ